MMLDPKTINDPERISLLQKHFKIWLMVQNDYLPGGYHAEVIELNKLHKRIHGVEARLDCPTCIKKLFDDLYIPFEGMEGSTLFNS